MNAVQLLQDVCQESGISGWQGISTTVGVTGQIARALEWVQKSWMSVQRASDMWQFMRFTATFSTVNGQWQYNGGGNESTAPTSPLVTANSATLINGVAPQLHSIVENSWRIYDNVSGIATEIHLNSAHDWDTFRELFRFSNIQLQTGRPTYITIMPNRDIALALIPDAGQGSGYTIYGDFYSKPQRLGILPGNTSIDETVPWMPEEFHELITWEAVYRYAGFQEAGAQYVHAKNMAQDLWQALKDNQLPNVEPEGPLV